MKLTRSGLELVLAMPGSYYRGTRFDWNGVFRSVSKDGIMYADTWFDTEDALRHDNVCGPSEEFSAVWIDSVHCVKVGVGILEVPEGREAYDRFKLYRILDGGAFDVQQEADCFVFTHVLAGYYTYVKTVRLEGENSFSIRHSLRWDGSAGASLDCYNHNFLTMGQTSVGTARVICFDAPVDGQWRPDSVSGYKDGACLRFERTMQCGEKCFIGNLTVPALAQEPYHFRVCEGAFEVDVRCDAPMDHAVFWSNHRVACVEPYVNIQLPEGQVFEWTIEYELKK